MTVYHSNFEDILTWLLAAEEQLDNCEKLQGKDVESVKKLFQNHEDFMYHLSQYQLKIEEIFNEGQDLIASDICDGEQKKEIQIQMDLLNSRWEGLRIKAMERQGKLHEALTSLQQKQIDDLKRWLSSVEEKISEFDLGSNLEIVKRQMNEHKILQEQIMKQQENVNSLSNMVVIVDDDRNENAFTALEDQLVALGERWAHVCKFVEDQGTMLRTVSSSWQKLNEGEKKFSQWLVKLDRRLNEMEEAAAETKPGSKFVLDLVKRLQKIETEMEIQQAYSSNLTEQAHLLLSKLTKDSPVYIEVTKNLEKLTQQWDSMLHRMEILGQTLATLSQPRTFDSPEPPQVTTSGEKHDLSTPATPTTASSSAKKRRLDSWRVQEWQRSLDIISCWLERVEESLGIDSDEDDGTLLWESLAPDEQQVLLEDTELDVENHKEEFNQLIGQGKQIVEDLNSSKYKMTK